MQLVATCALYYIIVYLLYKNNSKKKIEQNEKGNKNEINVYICTHFRYN